MEFSDPFQPCQIVCLEHEGTSLYAEVIQLLAFRPLFWVRPLMLGVWSPGTDGRSQHPPTQLYDLRQGADLVWPMSLFRLALDTEVIPLLTQLECLHPQPPDAPLVAHRQLKAFVHQVWQDNPEAFHWGRGNGESGIENRESGIEDR